MIIAVANKISQVPEKQIMDIQNQPKNSSVISWLRLRTELLTTSPSFQCAPPGDIDGVHPDIVERLWDQLGGMFPENCRWVLLGTPILLRCDSGIVFAIGFGMHYCLRLPPDQREKAIAEGAKTVKTMPSVCRKETRIHPEPLGPEWIYGKFAVEEEAWCSAAYDFAS